MAAVFVFAIAVYLSVTIPALKAVVNPAEADHEFTLDQNLGLLGAGNTIIAGLLVLILVMQARHPVFVKVATEAESFSCSGWTRVREARRSEGVGCGREVEDQGGQVGVNGCCVAPRACITLTLNLSRPRSRFPCTLGPIQFGGCSPGVPRDRYTLTNGCLSFKTKSRGRFRFLI